VTAARVHIQKSKDGSSILCTEGPNAVAVSLDQLSQLNLDPSSELPRSVSQIVDESVAKAFNYAYHWGIEYHFTWNDTKDKILPEAPTISYKQLTRTKSIPHVSIRAMDNSTMHLARGTIKIENVFLTSDNLASTSALSQDSEIYTATEEEVEENIILGIADLIANEENQILLSSLVKEKYFESAARLLHNEIADRLTATHADSESKVTVTDLDTKNQIYFNDPVVLNKLSDHIQKFKIAEELSTDKYTVRYMGDRTETDFNSFSNNIRYEERTTARKLVNSKLAAINNKEPTYSQAFTNESVLELEIFETVKNDKSQMITELTKIHDNFVDYPRVDQEERFVLKKVETKLEKLTYPAQNETQADHFLRVPLRKALRQRFTYEKSGHDTSLTVELPAKVHNIKETLTLFLENDHVTYDTNSGFLVFLEDIEKSVHLALDKCTPEELYYISAEMYKEAYTNCVKDKKVEMKINYPNLNQGELLMVYHGEALLSLDESTLDTVQRSCMFSPRPMAEAKSPDIRKAIENNLNLTLELSLKATNQHARFINALIQFANDDCRAALQYIQRRHTSMLFSQFVAIEEYTRDLTTHEWESIKSPGDFTSNLFTSKLKEKGYLSAEEPSLADIMHYLKPEEVNLVLKTHVEQLGLTDLKRGFPTIVSLTSYGELLQDASRQSESVENLSEGVEEEKSKEAGAESSQTPKEEVLTKIKKKEQQTRKTFKNVYFVSPRKEAWL